MLLQRVEQGDATTSGPGYNRSSFIIAVHSHYSWPTHNRGLCSPNKPKPSNAAALMNGFEGPSRACTVPTGTAGACRMGYDQQYTCPGTGPSADARAQDQHAQPAAGPSNNRIKRSGLASCSAQRSTWSGFRNKGCQQRSMQAELPA